MLMMLMCYSAEETSVPRVTIAERLAAVTDNDDGDDLSLGAEGFSVTAHTTAMAFYL